MKNRWLLGLVILSLLGASLALALPAQAEVSYLDGAALKAMLDDPQLLIIDVRTPKDWNSSDKKIKAAVRQDPNKVAEWGKALPKDKKIVLYCA